ncbi:cell division topological specificity factor [Cetobacterium ceti]|uniref:Cell division topological specificity factor n=1 Tax=Cetobacterium ceti TaxID=180163 RepID=A0A1T4MSX9_9FUSO|nr:cell division topological specificity factor MinE [Cetobacterium ceti]SJZ70179.1 cell division topological specificity factor [Cetobacterium ceti]
MALFNFFGKEKSGNIAKDRLKLVLIHDRSMISPRVLDDMRDEIIAVISKYVDIDRDSLNIEVSQSESNERRTTLVANIPIKSSK